MNASSILMAKILTNAFLYQLHNITVVSEYEVFDTIHTLDSVPFLKVLNDIIHKLYHYIH